MHIQIVWTFKVNWESHKCTVCMHLFVTLYSLKVAIEKGKKLDPHDDPIHDQSTYLDSKLRMRLFLEYGVKGYAIIQCAGQLKIR